MERTITEWVKIFNVDMLKTTPNRYVLEDVLIDMGWWDWFDYSLQTLKEFSKDVIKVINRIVNTDKFDKDKCYINLKQSLGCDGFINMIQISSIATGKVLYCISKTNNGWELWDFISGTDYAKKEGDWHNEVFEGKTLREVYKFFK